METRTHPIASRTRRITFQDHRHGAQCGGRDIAGRLIGLFCNRPGLLAGTLGRLAGCLALMFLFMAIVIWRSLH